MGSEDEKDHHEITALPLTANWKQKLEEQYRKTKEHAETYPYVWWSYIVVYGGIAIWTTYRWRKLRRTEDRVRSLQERLRKLVEAEEGAAGSSGSTTASSSSSHKLSGNDDPSKWLDFWGIGLMTDPTKFNDKQN